ncbi:MAG: phosphatase PAP2 family protein [Planctomycetes bacterium]|nr:phosphatase PAP2 family protein [Planctomycetota bacterium]
MTSNNASAAPHPLLPQLLCLTPLLLLLGALFWLFQEEGEIIRWFQAHRAVHPRLEQFAGKFCAYGNALFCGTCLMLGLRKARRGRKPDLRFALALAAYFLSVLSATYFLKRAVSRPRPPGPWERFDFFSPDGERRSFPSGHTVTAFALTLPLAQWVGKVVPPLLCGLYPAVMGLARMYLGRHWPSDLLGSAVLTWLGWFLCWRLAKR